jgi:excisionase family DNA binding protein
MSMANGPTSLDDFGDVLTEAEAAAVLRVSRMTLFRMRRDGRISAVKVGRKVLYRKSDLRRLIGGEETGN